MKKTALITGGNKGIGLEVTRYFMDRNFDIVVIARNFDNFEFINNANVKCIEYDLSNIAGIPTLVAELGVIDVLINNAGVMFSIPYNDYPQEKIEHILQLNIEAPVALMREVAKKMLQNNGGRIVNNASIAGQIGHPDIWYGITKAGLINVTKSLAKTLGAKGILINAVAPSPVETDMLQVIPEERKQDFKRSLITGRFATAKEVAETIGWLGTDSPEYINGICIDINNGSFMR